MAGGGWEPTYSTTVDQGGSCSLSVIANLAQLSRIIFVFRDETLIRDDGMVKARASFLVPAFKTRIFRAKKETVRTCATKREYASNEVDKQHFLRIVQY